MNDAFDIVKLGDRGLKKAVCEENINRIKEFNDKTNTI
jgi:hypothetical protein